MAPATTALNLVQVLTAMRNFGVGVNVRRSVWRNPGCYWRVTRIKPSPRAPYRYGKVWGVLHWNGRQVGEETQIGGVAKRQWMLDVDQPEGVSLRTLLEPRTPTPKPSEEAAAEEMTS
uniref:Uncharacterized protein n=1 Tax=Rhizochromulina marina TaxID=1034831 RepID=A0A7S2SVE1_9STRA|mmetsp:Transcript_9196/g.26164  ORF Transcript_9196/g.26164 Transcript_9196/m.26164 type:complete len:118 (+) Transcript_9196:37-390(+)